MNEPTSEVLGVDARIVAVQTALNCHAEDVDEDGIGLGFCECGINLRLNPYHVAIRVLELLDSDDGPSQRETPDSDGAR